MTTPADRLALARRELEKAQVGAIDPVDWLEVSLFSFHSLENAVVAAADREGVAWKKDHPSKASASAVLRDDYAYPDVENLLIELNELRKSESYGEFTATPSISAEDIVSEVEVYIDEVESRLDETP